MTKLDNEVNGYVIYRNSNNVPDTISFDAHIYCNLSNVKIIDGEQIFVGDLDLFKSNINGGKQIFYDNCSITESTVDGGQQIFYDNSEIIKSNIESGKQKLKNNSLISDCLIEGGDQLIESNADGNTIKGGSQTVD